jgi:hypothetical protein
MNRHYQRIDMRYDPCEDRLEIDLVCPEDCQNFSMTARLTRALVATLTRTLSIDDWSGDMYSDFTQMMVDPKTSSSNLGIREGVQTRILLEKIQVKKRQEHLGLNFSSAPEISCYIELNKRGQLRFMKALFIKFLEAEWNTDCWPQFLINSSYDRCATDTPVH